MINVLRDDLIRALQAQPHNEDVRLEIGELFVDLTKIDYDPGRETIVLTPQPEDVEDALTRLAGRKWWRVKSLNQRQR